MDLGGSDSVRADFADAPEQFGAPVFVDEVADQREDEEDNDGSTAGYVFENKMLIAIALAKFLERNQE
jgi:hypothetical protein